MKNKSTEELPEGTAALPEGDAPAQAVPFEHQRIFELEHRGARTEFEATSVHDMGVHRAEGRLRGSEFVRWPGQSSSMTVDSLLQQASAGLLEGQVVEAQKSDTTPAPDPVSVDDLKAALQRAQNSCGESKKYAALAAGIRPQAVKGEAVEDPGDELHRLQTTGDLADPKISARIAALCAVEATLPHRAELARQAHGRDLRHLLDVCHRFIKLCLQPRLADLETRAHAIVKSVIEPHVGPDELEFTISRSAVMSELIQIQQVAVISTFDQEDAPQLAQKLLEAWTAAASFERRKLT